VIAWEWDVQWAKPIGVFDGFGHPAAQTDQQMLNTAHVTNTASAHTGVF